MFFVPLLMDNAELTNTNMFEEIFQMQTHDIKCVKLHWEISQIITIYI